MESDWTENSYLLIQFDAAEEFFDNGTYNILPQRSVKKALGELAEAGQLPNSVAVYLLPLDCREIWVRYRTEVSFEEGFIDVMPKVVFNDPKDLFYLRYILTVNRTWVNEDELEETSEMLAADSREIFLEGDDEEYFDPEFDVDDEDYFDYDDDYTDCPECGGIGCLECDDMEDDEDECRYWANNRND